MEVLNEPLVTAALIAAIPSTIAAIAAVRANRQLKTGNGETVGVVIAKMIDHIDDDEIHAPPNAPKPTGEPAVISP